MGYGFGFFDVRIGRIQICPPATLRVSNAGRGFEPTERRQESMNRAKKARSSKKDSNSSFTEVTKGRREI
jgi:hypothetical protein